MYAAVLQQVYGNRFTRMVIITVGPNLTNSELFGLEGFHQEGEVHFTYAVCVFVAQILGNDQLDQQLNGVADPKGTQTNEGIQRADGQGAGHSTHLHARLLGLNRGVLLIAQTGCGTFVQQLLAVVNAHGQLVQEISHGRDGLVPFPFHIALILTARIFSGFVVGQRVIGFIVGDEFHVQVDVVAVLSLIAEADGFIAAVTGHQVFKAAEQVAFRVSDAFPVAPVIVAATFGVAVVQTFPVVDNFGISKGGHHAGTQQRNNR